MLKSHEKARMAINLVAPPEERTAEKEGDRNAAHVQEAGIKSGVNSDKSQFLGQIPMPRRELRLDLFQLLISDMQNASWARTSVWHLSTEIDPLNRLTSGIQ